MPGATLFLQAVQDIRVGGRAANAQYQFTLQADTVEELYTWAPKILAEMQKVPQLTDVNSDQQNKGLETDITIDRETAARLGITVAQIDNTLYDAFGQRQVSTIYNARNQYHVIMEVAPKYWQNAETLKDVYVSKSGGAVGGTQATNAVAGTVTRTEGRHRPPPRVAADAARNLALNSIGNTGKGTASTGSAVSTSRRNHGAAERRHPLRARQHSARRQSPGPVRRLHHLVQPRPGLLAQRRGRGRQRGDDPPRRAGHHSRHLPGHRAGVRAVAAATSPG